MAQSKTLPVSEPYKKRLYAEKRADETWEELLERLTGISKPSDKEVQA